MDDGLARNIDISNFNTQAILGLLTYARIHPSVLEIEYHPYLQQDRLVNWVKSQDIQVIAFASFGGAVFDLIPPSTAHLQNLFEHPVILTIAEKHNLNPGQVLLFFCYSTRNCRNSQECKCSSYEDQFESLFSQFG